MQVRSESDVRRNEQPRQVHDMRETPRAANENYGTRSYVPQLPLQVEKLGSLTYDKRHGLILGPFQLIKADPYSTICFRPRSLHS